MARHLLHSFLLTLPAFWSVLTLVFLLIHIVPGDPVEQMLGEAAAPGKVAQLRHAPSASICPSMCSTAIIFGNSRTASWGNLSKFKGPSAASSFFEGSSATLQLVFLALVVCAAIAIPSPLP